MTTDIYEEEAPVAASEVYGDMAEDESMDDSRTAPPEEMDTQEAQSHPEEATAEMGNGGKFISLF